MSLSATLISSNTIVTGPSITFGGFTQSTLNQTPPPSSIVNNINLVPSSIKDSYDQTQGSSGFYQNSYNTLILKDNILAASPYDYVATVNQSGAFTTNASFTYQCDNLITAPPTITSLNFSLTGIIPSTQICGLTILYSTPTVSITTVASNMGNYYYRRPLINYSGSYGAWTPATETNTANIKGGKGISSFTGPITVVNNAVTSPSLNSTYKSTLTLSATASNIFNTSPSVVAVPINYIIDGPSYTLVNTILAQTQTSNTLITNTPQPGCRSESEKITLPSLMPSFNLPALYNNSTDITSNQELQISNGYFVSKSASLAPLAYLNYNTFFYDSTRLQTIDYSKIATTVQRYATFVWSIPKNTSNINLSFTINGTFNMKNYASLLCDSNNNPIEIYYRTVNSLSTTPISGGNKSSSWINANTTSGTTAGSGNWQSNIESGSPVLLKGLLSLSDTNYVLSVYYPLSGAIVTPDMYLILRIGIPMNRDIGFKSVSATLS